MNVSFAIQHHPSRADLVVDLLRQIRSAEIVVDPDPDGIKSPWRTYRHALEKSPADATHRVIVQDDVIVCAGFEDAVRAAIAARPDRMIVLFVGGNARRHAQMVRQAARAGCCWLELTNLPWCPAVAVVWPTGLIEPCLSFVDRQKWPESFRADDEIIGRFLREEKIVPLATVPSLVDHPDDVASLIGRRARHGLDTGRIGACWIGDCDPAAIDWENGATYRSAFRR